MQRYMSILGHRVKDRVTGMEGIATSVSFDLYGCVQVVVNPGIGADGKPQECNWYDFKRLEVRNDFHRVMEPPDFSGREPGPERLPRQSAI